jgi:short-subunit dehydrogenase
MTAGIGRTILLTGAANGIGRATALALAARGERLGLIDWDQQALASLDLGEANGGRIARRCADVRDGRAMRAAVVEIEREVGPTGMLVACAGIGGLTLLPDLNPAALRDMLEVNVVGVANAIDAVLPGMIERGRGHLLGVSSVAGYRGMPWMSAYSASKAALSTYLEGLRPALKRRGVGVTTVYPGFVRTAITEGTPFRRPVPMMEPERAARFLLHAIDRRPRDFAFPMGTALGMGLLRRMPNRVYDWMMDRAGPEALTVEF